MRLMEAQEESLVIRSAVEHPILLQDDQKTGWLLGDEVNDVLVVLVRDGGPVQTLSLILQLLIDKDMFIELLL
jgi:hypothetical protein